MRDILSYGNCLYNRTNTSGVLLCAIKTIAVSVISGYIQSFCWGHVDMCTVGTSALHPLPLMLNSTRATTFNFGHIEHQRDYQKCLLFITFKRPLQFIPFHWCNMPQKEFLVETHVTACQARIHINWATSFFRIVREKNSNSRSISPHLGASQCWRISWSKIIKLIREETIDSEFPRCLQTFWGGMDLDLRLEMIVYCAVRMLCIGPKLYIYWIYLFWRILVPLYDWWTSIWDPTTKNDQILISVVLWGYTSGRSVHLSRWTSLIFRSLQSERKSPERLKSLGERVDRINLQEQRNQNHFLLLTCSSYMIFKNRLMDHSDQKKPKDQKCYAQK